jgi:phospholipid/cholesterol/gamma-HCH transport system substrate-binding protein
MENRSHALAAGIFVLVLSFAAAFAVWWLGQSSDDVDRYVLETRRNVTGLNVQAAVRYRGIRAGKVERIETDPADPRVIQVYVTLDSRFKLTRAATAQLGYQGVTGLAYIQIEDDRSVPERLEGKGGDLPRIALKPTLFDSLGDKVGDIVAQVSTVATRLATVLDEKNARNLARSLENMAAGSEAMKELPAVMASLRQAVSPANLQRLNQILAHVEKTAGQGAPLAAEMRETVRAMTALAQKLDRVAGQGELAGEELAAATLPRASVLMREAAQNARQLNQLLERLESNPQMLIFGNDAGRPGPGEAGFAAPGTKEEK